MSPYRGAVLVAFFCLVCMTLGASGNQQCRAPNWDDAAGPNPFTERRGKVVLVAFLKGYCGYCVRQAGDLYALKNELAEEGYPDIDMIIINGGEPRARNLVHNLVNASPIPVIQDTPLHSLYRRVFRAYKDDFLVYDRCNQAAIYIPHPYSDLQESTITKQVLKAVHMGRHDCYCSLDYAPRSMDDVMMGDDPGVRFYQTHDMTRNVLHCNAGDARCLQFNTALTTQLSDVNNRSGRAMQRPPGMSAIAFRRLVNNIRFRARRVRPGQRGYMADSGVGQGRVGESGARTGLGGGSRRGFGGGRRGFGSGRRGFGSGSGRRGFGGGRRGFGNGRCVGVGRNRNSQGLDRNQLPF